MTNTRLFLSQMVLYGYTQGTLAKKLGISRYSLSKKIHNKVAFTVKEISALCDILHIGDKDKFFFVRCWQNGSDEE